MSKLVKQFNRVLVIMVMVVLLLAGYLAVPSSVVEARCATEKIVAGTDVETKKSTLTDLQCGSGGAECFVIRDIVIVCIPT